VLPVNFIFLMKNVGPAAEALLGEGLLLLETFGALGMGGSSWGRD